MLQKPEILAPAGDQTKLAAALNAGCDAVYFGIKGMNMRAGARNFALDALPDVVAQCRESDAKAYLALNTIIFEDGLTAMNRNVEAAARAGVDAIIAWDPSVLSACQEFGIEPHLSTQASVSNSAAILKYHRLYGINRFVLARECTLEQIVSMQERLTREFSTPDHPIEIEAFCHGAMCVSVSGRCFLSHHTFGVSANCGECLQPCRREYKIIDTYGEAEYVVGHDYIMSPNDMCTLPFIDKLIEAGIGSLKIEGRNRSPEYVHTVTRAYRNAVDVYFEEKGKEGFEERLRQVKSDGLEAVAKVYNRGFSKGFYMGKPLDEWTDGYGNKATRTKNFVGLVKKYYPRIGVAEILVQSTPFGVGNELSIQGATTGVVESVVEAIELDRTRIETAEKGSLITVHIGSKVRPNDQVYVYRRVPADGQGDFTSLKLN